MSWNDKRAVKEIKRALERADLCEAKFGHRGQLKSVGFEVRLRPGHIEVLPWVKDSSREHEAVLLAGYKVSIERAFTDYVVTVSDDRHEPRRLIIALKA